MLLHPSWRKLAQESIKTMVTAGAVIAIMLVTAQNPSADDAVRGLAAGVVGSLFGKLSRLWVG